jgi:hypothetical protein
MVSLGHHGGIRPLSLTTCPFSAAHARIAAVDLVLGRLAVRFSRAGADFDRADETFGPETLVAASA